jgi:predicted nucleotide-binding protein (sugar kinase/HSP70/actin superfamily)
VVSVNLSGLEHNPGFSLGLKMLRRMINAIYYGDLLTCLANQCKPYEVNKGETDQLVQTWQDKLIAQFGKGGGLSSKEFLQNMDDIAASFAALSVEGPRKVAVGIVGEIYVKFSSLGNNNLEQFLLDEGAEPVVPGLADFMIFKINNRDVDVDLYGGKKAKQVAVRTMQKYFEDRQAEMIAVIKKYPQFRAPEPFSHLQELIKGYVGYGNKMGEGWLLTAEMLDLIHSGVGNIVCTQPFGCLPNHVAGKGMIRKLKDDYPDSNIVAIDYDPGATKINQENRIKLMLANAARAKQKAEKAAEKETVAV